MKLPSFFNRSPNLKFISGKEKTEAEANAPSSRVLMTSQFIGYVEPPIPFSKFYEYYYTIPKIQNGIDKVAAKILARDWYFDSKVDARIKRMNEWERDYGFSRIIQYYVYDSLITGNFMITKRDWTPVQMSAILGAARDDYGNIQKYAHYVGSGSIEPFDADEVFHERYIEIDRQPWGISLLHSLAMPFKDIDGDDAIPYAEIYRQLGQDFGKIIHRLGSPRILYAFQDLPDEQLEEEAKKLIALKPGRRGVINQIPEFITETVDARSRFPEYIEHVRQDFDAGTQTSANRLITQPSAMADAKEAGEQDDDLTLGIMERIRRFMDEKVIPYVLDGAECTFHWGSKDDFNVELPPGLDRAVALNIITRMEARDILRARSWKLRDDKEWLAQQQQAQTIDQRIQQQIQDNKRNPANS